MGALLVATYVLASRSRTWRSPHLPGPEASAYAGGGGTGSDGYAAGGRGAWLAGFLTLALVIGVGAVLFVGDSVSAADTAGIAAFVVFLAAFVGFLVLGLYRSAQSWGLHGAQAAAVGAWAGGVLLLLAIVVFLLTTG